MMFVVGLTGGIGSGKSTVANAFHELGIELVDADVVARQVVEPGTSALAAIAAHFGNAVLQADGSLDRKALREIVFADDKQRLWLNDLLHPLIRQEMQRQLQAAPSPYVLFVVPLLFENGLDGLCDRTLVIDVPQEVQLQRVLARDDTNPETVKGILHSQMDRAERLARADDVLDNSGQPEKLKAQVQQLHQSYLAMARQKALS
ncbi:dephospho-CoA kinase [Gallaecimonas sp. GXIMD4217]|uniref:dephospho-CoA kinase n=1 Tax=Gallaecimonas sp. GXIMD4217 TaxID=3131927 RepID=UPI00311AC457